MEELGDHHSFLRAAGEDDQADAAPSILPPRWSLHATSVGENFAYVRVPGFMGDSQQVQSFAAQLAGLVAERLKQSPRGWIVDLRPN